MTNFSYALSRTKQFNEFVLNNNELSKIFVLGDYNFLQIYQQLIFIDFRLFYERKSADYLLPAKQADFLRSLAIRLLSVLYSIFSYAFLLFSRRKVLVYSTDKVHSSQFACDYRMVNLYGQLANRKIKFAEALHTAYDDQFLEYLFKRRHPAIYLESADVFYKVFWHLGFWNHNASFVDSLDLSFFDHDAKFVRLLLKKYLGMISQTRFRINFLSRLLGLTGIKILFVVPDTRNYHEIVQACKLTKIKTFSFFSGELSKYDMGLIDCSGNKGNIIKPDIFFLPSQYWIDELLRLGSIFKKEELVIGGDIKEDRIVNGGESYSDRKNREGVSILMNYETEAPKEEVIEYVRRFLKCPDTRVIFSIRPARDVETQQAQYRIKNMPENFSTTTKLGDAIDRIDIYAGTHSTLAYDLIGYYKPIVILKTSLDVAESMIANKLADVININETNFCERLREIKNTSQETLIERRQRLYEGAVPLKETLKNILTSQLNI